MKKLLSILLVMLLCISMVACGSSEPAATPAPAAPAPAAPAPDAPAASDDPYAHLGNYDVKVVVTAVEGETPSGELEGLLKQIEEKSYGHLKFDLTKGGSTIYNGEAELYDLLKSGSYDLANFAPTQFADVYDAIQATSWVYLYESVEHGNAFWGSEDAQKLYDMLEEKSGVHPIYTMFFGTRNLSTKDKPINSPADLNGVKIRVMDSAIYVAGMEAMGALAVPITYSELYMSLQTGVCDGQENANTVIESGKFYEVQEVLNITEHNILFETWCANSDFWNNLPAEFQDLIATSYIDYWSTYDEWCVEENKRLQDKFVDEYGMTINEDVNKQAFVDAAEEAFYANYGDKADWVELYEMIKKYA